MLTKLVGNEAFPVAAFLHVGDSENPETWEVPFWESLQQEATPKAMNRAAMALRSGKTKLSPGSRDAAIRKLHGKYQAQGVRKRDLPAAMQAAMAYAARRRKMKESSDLAAALLERGTENNPFAPAAIKIKEDDAALAEHEHALTYADGLLDGEMALEQVINTVHTAMSEYHKAYHSQGMPGFETGNAWDDCLKVLSTTPERVTYEMAGKQYQRSYAIEGANAVLSDDEIALSESLALGESRETMIREAYLPTVVPGTTRLNREGRTLHNAVLITQNSLNGPNGRRKYSDKALRQVSKMAEGIQGFFDHAPREQMGQARPVRELVGRYTNVRFDENQHRVTGDFIVLKPHVDTVFALAEDMPDIVGLSVVSRGVVKMEGDTEVVDDILEVRSIDLVSAPGATRGLFEHLEHVRAQRGGDDMELTLEKIQEFLAKNPATSAALRESLAGADLKKLATELEESKGGVTKLEATSTTLIEGLKKELAEAQAKLVQYEAAAALQAKQVKLAEAIEKSELGKGKKFSGMASEKFVNVLMSLEESKWEEQIGDLVDTLQKASKGTTVVTSHGKDLGENKQQATGTAHERLLKLVQG